MYYLTTPSNYFFTAIWTEGRECLFNDALNTFYLRLYGVRHNMVKDDSDSERGNPLPPYGLLFPIRSKGMRVYTYVCMIVSVHVKT